MAASPVVRSAIVYALLFGGVGAFFPYIAIYYRHIGMPLEVVGVLLAAQAAVGLVAAPTWGSVADRSRDLRRPLALAGAWAGLAATWLAFARHPLEVIVAAGLLGAGSAGIGPMLDNLTIERLGENRDRFGRARAWGSASFIVVSLLTGALIDRAGPPGLFLAYVPALLGTALGAWLLLGGPTRRRRSVTVSPLAGLVGIARHPALSLFFAGSVVIWTCVSALSTFISVHLVSLGAEGPLVGLVFALGAATEVPLMLLFPAIARRAGHERLIVVGAVAFAVRAAAWALAGQPLLIIAMAPLGGLGFGLYYVATVGFVARSVPADVQATAQGLFSGTAFSSGSIAGSLAGGVVAAAFGLPTVFALSAVGTVLGAVVVWWAIGASRGPSGRRRTSVASAT